MAIPVVLQDVAEAMDLPSTEWRSYINRKTGEIVTVTEEDRRLAEADDVDDAEDQAWGAEQVAKAREALESVDFLCLPDAFEIHEWAIMKDFALRVARPAAREALLDAIHGSGAFRLFKSTIHRLGIEKDWYRFRDEAIEKIARDWLDAHQIPYRSRPAGGRSA